MSLDSSKISIISSTKVNPEKLGEIGDHSEKLAPAAVRDLEKQEKRCNLCCVAIGSILSTFTVVLMVSIGTGLAVINEKRVNNTVNGVMRQIAWGSLPGVLVGSSMHFFLSEAMWSGKRNTWGQAWVKASTVNTMVWLGGIGAGTVFWRHLLPLTAWGRRVFHRYPISTVPLDIRVIRSEKEMFTGMGWSYWLSGVVSGQFSFLTCVGFCVWNDRPHFMMSPNGGYATRCLPRWRRQQMARNVNMELS